jgi:hypothetical protein
MQIAQAQSSGASALLQTLREQLLLPHRFKVLAEIIDATEQFF